MYLINIYINMYMRAQGPMGPGPGQKKARARGPRALARDPALFLGPGPWALGPSYMFLLIYLLNSYYIFNKISFHEDHVRLYSFRYIRLS